MSAQSIEALDQLQIEADKLVVAIIHQTEHEEFDESARMSFSLALEQARFAIAARRADRSIGRTAQARRGGAERVNFLRPRDCDGPRRAIVTTCVA